MLLELLLQLLHFERVLGFHQLERGALLVLGGVLSTLGDRLGSRVGKAC